MTLTNTESRKLYLYSRDDDFKNNIECTTVLAFIEITSLQVKQVSNI